MDGALLTQWLARLETLHPNPIDLGLERVARVASALDIIPVGVPVVTVAGTNGKGSTVAVLEALLSECGHITGVYTSPHMLRFNERIRVGTQEASDAEIVAAFEAIDSARGDTTLTYFEFATLAALLVFRARDVDVLVLEVGLGGRLDAVNIIDPTVAVITCIDLDHQGWLGTDRGSIAQEKGGIMRRGVPVVIADRQPPAELFACAEAIGAKPILRLGHEFAFEERDNVWEGRLLCPNGTQRTLPQQPRSSLIPDNICAGLQAALQLGCEFDNGQLSAALNLARPRGRCERFQVADYEVVLDVAHNPGSVYNLVEFLSITHCKGKTISLFSVMEDKDVGAMIRAAGQCFDSWLIAGQPDNPRAARAADIALVLQQQGQVVASISADIRQAFRRAQHLLQSGDRLVVFGSFFTVAEVLPLLEQTA
tara:strand:+ start:130792 stop:132066 length:1275 start_codon:yes stop_codon:yes gene_type:complete